MLHVHGDRASLLASAVITVPQFNSPSQATAPAQTHSIAILAGCALNEIRNEAKPPVYEGKIRYVRISSAASHIWCPAVLNQICPG